MRIGWSRLFASLFVLLGGQATFASDDVGAILSDLTATEAPCASELERLNAAVELAPGDLALRRRRGVCLYRLGRLELARTDLKQGLGAVDAAADIEPWVVGAIVEAREGQFPQAKNWLGQAQARVGEAHPQVVRGAVLVQGLAGDLPGAWTALDAALAQAPDDPTLRTAAAELIALDPDGATPAARAAMGRRVKTVTRHNRASSWLNAGQPAACVAEAEGALAEADASAESDVAALHVLAWRCGVAAAQVGTATRHLKAMGRDVLRAQSPGTVVAHVRLLRDAGQHASARKLLNLVKPVSEADLRDVATLKVGLEVLLGDLDAALAGATEHASPVSRANLAKALHGEGRTAEAVALLERTCGGLEDPEGCRAWTDHLRSGL